MRVNVEPSFAAEYFGSRQEFDIEAGNVFQLVEKLDHLGSGFAEIAEVRVIFAVDGTVANDWSVPLSPASEVFVIPRIGGGQGGLKWRKLEPFGAEILRDLSEPLTADEEDHFRNLFNEHGLILARDQSLSMQRQREICGLLGPVVDRQGETGYMTNEGGGASSSAYCWHSDAAYTRAPFDALALHALDVVDDASSTCFASAEAALAALPDELVDVLEASEQEMIAPHQDRLAERTCDQREPFGYKRGVRPGVLVNPHNGRRCIWVNEMQTVRLLGMEWEASRDLLHRIYDRIYDPSNVLEHRWRKGDIVIWDNIALQHARGNLEKSGKRLLQRVIVGTEGVIPFIED